MKNLKKTVLALLCVVMACFMLTGCEKTSSQIEEERQEQIQAENLEDVRTYTTAFANMMASYSYEDFAAQTAQSYVVGVTFDNDWGNRWEQFTEDCGTVTAANVDLVERTSTGFTGRIILTGDEAHGSTQMALTITYDEACRPISTAIAAYSDDSQATLGSKMASAGVNTVTGLLVVFFMLVFLSLIIACFKFLNPGGSEVKPEKKDAAPAPSASKPAAAPAARSEEIDLAKNQELVAVIAAAIAASEGGNPSGYVVRSIRRLHNNKWR